MSPAQMLADAGGVVPAVEVRASVTARSVDLEVELRADTTTAVVGPNGAGKSTLLHLVAGVVAPDSGAVRLAGGEVTDQPPHRRRVGLLTQRPVLFDHLDALDNVAFGVRARGAGRRQARARAAAELAAVGLSALHGRRPRQLSGGQAQRVALARALAIDPEVLLLDEPMAALDVEAAQAMRVLLAERLAGRSAVLVTHDPLDLWMLADRVCVLEGGHVTQQGHLAEVAERPGTAFLAGLLDTNRLVGRAVGESVVRIGEGPGAVEVVGVAPTEHPPEPGHGALALVDPGAITLELADVDEHHPLSSARNRWPVRVQGVEPRGAVVRTRLSLGQTGQGLVVDLTARSAADLWLRPGSHLVASVKATQVRCVRDLRAE